MIHAFWRRQATVNRREEEWEKGRKGELEKGKKNS